MLKLHLIDQTSAFHSWGGEDPFEHLMKARNPVHKIRVCTEGCHLVQFVDPPLKPILCHKCVGALGEGDGYELKPLGRFLDKVKA